MVDPNEEVPELARRQHGLLTEVQARAELGAQGAEHWRRSGRLEPLQPRVLRVTSEPRSWHQDVLAAALATDGVVSHRAAAELWALVEPEGCVEVTAHPASAERLWPPAVVHLGVRRAEHRAGVPVTDPLDTLCDLAEVLRPWALSAAIDTAITTGLVSADAVAHLLAGEVAGRADDAPALRRQVQLRPTPSASEQAEVADLVEGLLARVASRIPRRLFEVWHEGRFVARADAAHPQRRIALVVDRVGRVVDRWTAVPDLRATRLAAAGWQVVTAAASELRRTPDAVAERVALQVPLPERPAPPVRFLG
jgi:hypothetical protein